MPQSLGSILSIVRRGVLVPTRESADEEGIVLLWHWGGREVHPRCVACRLISRTVAWHIVREPDLVRLVDVQHVDFVVP